MESLPVGGLEQSQVQGTLNALRHQWNPHGMGSNLLVYKNLCVLLRDT
jgi:hypothetical protein